MADAADLNLLPVAEDLRAAMLQWQEWLRDERRASPNTLSSYQFDLANLLEFLNGYFGKQIKLSMLANVSLMHFRAWLAHNAGIDSFICLPK